MKILLWNLSQLGVVLLSLAALVVAWRAGSTWLHDGRRFGNALLGAAAVLLGAAAAVLEYRAGPSAGLLSWLRLPAAMALPVMFIILLRALRRRDAIALSTARDAPFDHATGLPNHALLLRQIVPALARSRREGSSAIILVTGIDGFAAVQDRHGPGAAAEMLRSLATILADATRAGDLSGHVEPAVLGTLLPAATGEAAERIANRLRSLASERLVDPEMSGRRPTVSVGIAVVGDGVEPAALEEAISSALSAYRMARDAGGDQLRLAPEPPARSAGVPA